MKRRKMAGKLLAVGALGVATAIPTAAAVATAPKAHADGCGGGGVVFWGGGGGCDQWTPGGNHVMCGSGYGAGSGGGGCKIEWGGDPGNFTICNVTVTVQIPFLPPIYTRNRDCPFVP